MITEIIGLVLLVVVLIWYNGRHPENPNFPRGPFVFPLLGSVPHFIKGPLKVLIDWRKEYGPMVGLRIGSFRAVLINDYETIKEAFNEKAFSGRPAIPPLLHISKGGKRGLTASEGPLWEEQRRFTLRHLRDFGFGKKSMEGLMQEYTEDIISGLLKEKGKPVNTIRRFNLAVLGALWKIVTGEKLDVDSTVVQEQLDFLNGLINSLSANSVGFLIPWTLKVAPGLVGWNRFKDGVHRIHTFMQGKIDEHKNTYQEDNMRDLMDLYLAKIKETDDPNSAFYKREGELNMLVGMINLFVAGSETTNMTINWALLYLSQWKDVQAKLFEEVNRVVGTSRLPSLEDRPMMPYTEAVMMETFRLSSIVPIGVFHNTTENVLFRGYDIPKDTVVFANLYGLHHDPSIWGRDVENFRPERFLGPEGKITAHHPPVIPFSIGKRVCLGETLARVEFFMFLTSLSQRFEFSLDPTLPEPDLSKVQGLFRKIPEFKLILKDRQETEE